MKPCPQCGTKNTSIAENCKKCGAPLAAGVAPVHPQAPVYGAPPPGQVPPGQVSPGYAPPPPGQVPPGYAPPPPAPPGYPPQQYAPPGQMPAGYPPPGQVPPGQVPPGYPPQGQMPAGQPYGAPPYGAPPYGAPPYGAPPVGRKKPLPSTMLITLLTVFLIFAGVFGTFGRAFFGIRREQRNDESCQSNLKRIGLALKQYEQDYDELLPPAMLANQPGALSPYGWADAANIYAKDDKVFQCPAEENYGSSDPASSSYTDYHLNEAVAGKNEVQIPNSWSTIIMADGTAHDARYTSPGMETGGNPAANERHYNGANYAFMDGHVKHMRPEDVGGASDPIENGPGYATGEDKSGVTRPF